MSVSLPQLRVGDPLRHEALSVFPLFAEPQGQIDYRLSVEALTDKSVTVEEISDYLKDQAAKYKHPRKIQMMAELPLTATMKVKKGELKEQYGARLNN